MTFNLVSRSFWSNVQNVEYRMSNENRISRNRALEASESKIELERYHSDLRNREVSCLMTVIWTRGEQFVVYDPVGTGDVTL